VQAGDPTLPRFTDSSGGLGSSGAASGGAGGAGAPFAKRPRRPGERVAGRIRKKG